MERQERISRIILEFTQGCLNDTKVATSMKVSRVNAEQAESVAEVIEALEHLTELVKAK